MTSLTLGEVKRLGDAGFEFPFSGDKIALGGTELVDVIEDAVPASSDLQ